MTTDQVLEDLITRLRALEKVYEERRKHEQAEKLLQRAADLINAAWNTADYIDGGWSAAPVYINGVPWVRAAGRWISDYERRDEWIDPNANH